MHDNDEVQNWVWHNVAERTNLCLTSCDDRDEYRSRIFQCLGMKATAFYLEVLTRGQADHRRAQPVPYLDNDDDHEDDEAGDDGDELMLMIIMNISFYNDGSKRIR